ncbi:hypothetical protein B0H12DRAFT_1078031 [Mycena haematopus]|nr:hypothetical protein B0H12DRAFT_1078031 [Mycena haematopus]
MAAPNICFWLYLACPSLSAGPALVPRPPFIPTDVVPDQIRYSALLGLRAPAALLSAGPALVPRPPFIPTDVVPDQIRYSALLGLWAPAALLSASPVLVPRSAVIHTDLVPDQLRYSAVLGLRDPCRCTGYLASTGAVLSRSRSRPRPAPRRRSSGYPPFKLEGTRGSSSVYHTNPIPSPFSHAPYTVSFTPADEALDSRIPNTKITRFIFIGGQTFNPPL